MRHRGAGRIRRPRKKDTTVLWANAARQLPSHLTILQKEYEEEIDVICIQEPNCMNNTRTKTHPGYDLYAPVDSWGMDGSDCALMDERPRILSYTKKGESLYVQQRRPLQSKVLLWITVNDYHILNAHR
ncbi:hypothetical protein K3495_g9682 [Podosphaera aphanis]|nr:hypothetical protein K3495_g9682 [Podosphaera aphanis]